jgi:hypothetical protein
LTQDNYIGTGDPQDQGVGEESAVIKALRKQIRDKDAELAARPDRDTLIAELRQELERDNAIGEELTFFGHPKGILDSVKKRLGDAEVSREGVAEALRSIGYQVEIADVPADSGEGPSQQLADLAKVSDLSSQVRAASQGANLASEVEKVAQAQTPEDLVRLAAEGGWLAQQ